MRTPEQKTGLILTLRANAIQELCQELSNEVDYFRIGPELATTPDLSRLTAMIAECGGHIFYDMVLNDRPAAIARAVSALIRQKVSMISISSFTSDEALKEAVEEAKDESGGTVLIVGTTQLARDPELKELFNVVDGKAVTDKTWQQLTRKVSQRLERCGLHGIIALSEEIEVVRLATPKALILARVAHGIPWTAGSGSIIDALKAGADYVILDPPGGLTRVSIIERIIELNQEITSQLATV